MGVVNFLRRMNRGIALAVLLVIGLSCYLTVDSIAFSEQRDIIKQTLEDYAKDMSEFVLLPEQYREIGVDVPKEVIEKKTEQNNAVIDRYFSDSLNRWGYNLKSWVKENQEVILKYNADTGNKVKSSEAKLTRVKSIIKHGASLATVEAVMDITTSSTRDAEVIHVFYGGGRTWYGDMTDQKPEEMEFSSRSHEVTFICEMVKRDGEWKFSNQEGMYTMQR